MFFRSSLRFKGYWLSLFAWLVLSFATPLANAVAQNSAGWMRMCSAHGVLWVQSSSLSSLEAGQANSDDCVCLSFGLACDNNLEAMRSEPVMPVEVAGYTSIYFTAPLRKQQPRSPPNA